MHRRQSQPVGGRARTNEGRRERETKKLRDLEIEKELVDCTVMDMDMDRLDGQTDSVHAAARSERGRLGPGGQAGRGGAAGGAHPVPR